MVQWGRNWELGLYVGVMDLGLIMKEEKTMRREREGRAGGEWEEDDRNSATRNAVNQYSTKMFR